MQYRYSPSGFLCTPLLLDRGGVRYPTVGLSPVQRMTVDNQSLIWNPKSFGRDSNPHIRLVRVGSLPIMIPQHTAPISTGAGVGASSLIGAHEFRGLHRDSCSRSLSLLISEALSYPHIKPQLPKSRSPSVRGGRDRTCVLVGMNHARYHFSTPLKAVFHTPG